ncbi:MAG: mechanosensitive ion channel [Bacteroidales bacterium]|nr:mechanosensitive ion channel [Bacteroidales bacterium]
MNKKRLLFLAAFVAIVMPLLAISYGQNLNQTLRMLRNELNADYHQIDKERERLTEDYEEQRLKMIDLMKQCNELSLTLYSQKQGFTFDVCYALEKVTKKYNEFNQDRGPFDRIVGNLNVEMERYARLIESLRRLPPELDSITGMPDSLLFRNDTLNQHLYLSGTHLELEKEVMALSDSLSVPFVLDEQGENDRERCIFYACEILKMYADTKATVVADSVHYYETYLRLKESYDYAHDYYQVLQNRIFVEGQTPWFNILKAPKRYWRQAMDDAREKYDLGLLASLFGKGDGTIPTDSLVMQVLQSDSVTVVPADTMLLETDTWLVETSETDSVATASTPFPDVYEKLPVNTGWEYSLQVFIIFLFLVELLAICLVVSLLLIPVFRYVKPFKDVVAKEHRRFVALLIAIIITIIVNANIGGEGLLRIAARLTDTFLWLLAAILIALLIRLKAKQLKYGIRLYLPVFCMALTVIGCRVVFMPNSLMNFVFPPVLVVFFVWQLLACLHNAKKVDRSDRLLGWMSLVATGAALGVTIAGYIFASLLILVWWYFQLAAIHTIYTVLHLIVKYREKRMKPRIDDYRSRINFITGPGKETLMFGATWFYDLVKDVVLPVMALMSVPFCIRLALGVFDFDDLFSTIYHRNFVQLVNDSGADTFRLSFYGILLLVSLVFVFRYANRALHAIWQQVRYAIFMKKHNRKTIRNNEINLSLGNSIVSVLVWMTYIVIVVLTLHIPTGSLSLVAGGLSAGIGLALKDTLNNFIYGIQLMSGRLRIGDWIVCDGIRGKVTHIGYQSTEIETVDGAEMSFLNATLFAKNFSNLTRNHGYEFVKITVGVAYGTDIQRVRELLGEALQALQGKDTFGRDIVGAKRGVSVSLEDMDDSAVTIAVKQQVLVAERVGYIDRAKELIYNTLNENGIAIPFPQCDVHLVREE